MPTADHAAGPCGIGPTAASSCGERHRRLAEQHAEDVHRLRAPAARGLRDRRRGGGDLGLGARHVELGGEPGGEQPARQGERVLLRLDVVVRERDALLQAAIGDVVAADLAEQRDQHRGPVELAPPRGSRLRRLDGAAVAAEHVQLPARVEADLVEVETLSRDRRARPVARSCARARSAPARSTFGQRSAAAIGAQRARLPDARLGLLQVEVRLRGPRDERGELGSSNTVHHSRRRCGVRDCVAAAPAARRRWRRQLAPGRGARRAPAAGSPARPCSRPRHGGPGHDEAQRLRHGLIVARRSAPRRSGLAHLDLGCRRRGRRAARWR